MKQNIRFNTHQTHDFVFKSMAIEYPYLINTGWDIPPRLPVNEKFDFIDEVIHLTISDAFAAIVYKTSDDMLINLQVYRRSVGLSIAAKSRKGIDEYTEELKEKFPEIQEAEDGLIDLKFHFLTQTGPNYISRKIAVPDWEEISENYEKDTRKSLEYLFTNFKASHGGQLILFQGEPGTGKSFALRALCDAWKSWCSVEYIVDPDAFFGGSSSYLMNLLSDTNDMYDDDYGELVDLTDTAPVKKEWKLFILEDTGELLTEDAKDRVGQGLARLLNVVDGFIGQGLRILILITSNEDLGKLHPAVSRPGRAASIIKFNALDAAHAEQWAASRNVPLESRQSYTLAELFSLANEFENKKIKTKVASIGFRLPAGA